MSANLDTMMYVGQQPWHKQGTRLNSPGTASEAIKAANLEWKVAIEPIYLVNQIQVPKKMAVVRKDTSNILGIVGNVYRPLQNSEAFSFFDAVVGEKEAIYHTAGSLGKGERVWILVKLPRNIRVKSEDLIEKYLLLSNNHDGNGSVRMMFTPIRVVCQNTLNIALAVQEGSVALRHTVTIGNRIADVKQKLGIINTQYTLFESLSKRLAEIPVSYNEFVDFATTLLLNSKEIQTEKAKVRAQQVLDEAVTLFEHGKGNDIPDIAQTKWTAFNAIAEYADFVKVKKSRTSTNSANSILFGDAATLKRNAWNLITQNI